MAAAAAMPISEMPSLRPMLYNEGSELARDAATKLRNDAVLFKSSTADSDLGTRREKIVGRLEWIKRNFLTKLNTDEMKKEEIRRIRACWACGILFQKYGIPLIQKQLKNEMPPSHTTNARRNG